MLADGFLVGEQLTPGAPWRIRIDKAVRDRLAPEGPEGWLRLADAAKALGMARQTVLHKSKAANSKPSKSTKDGEKDCE